MNDKVLRFVQGFGFVILGIIPRESKGLLLHKSEYLYSLRRKIEPLYNINKRAQFCRMYLLLNFSRILEVCPTHLNSAFVMKVVQSESNQQYLIVVFYGVLRRYTNTTIIL